jgi:hypothetical protein
MARKSLYIIIIIIIIINNKIQALCSNFPISQDFL